MRKLLLAIPCQAGGSELEGLQLNGCLILVLQISIAAAVLTGVANRVLYKLALVPMGDYVFVLSQFQTFGYCLVYFGFLFGRYRLV